MKTIGIKEMPESSEHSGFKFDMNKLADNMSVIESVKCQICGKMHERSEDTYMSVYGNICVGEVGGIIGGGDWGKTGVPVNTFCPRCLYDFILNYDKEVAR